MSSDFVGVGTGAMYARLLADFGRVCWGALRAARSRLAGADDADNQVVPDFDDVAAVREVARTLLLQDGFAPSTTEKYVSCVGLFLRRTGKSRLSELRTKDVRVYLRWLRTKGKKNGTIRLHLCALRAVFDELLEHGITGGIAHVPRPAPRPAASPDEVGLLFSACACPKERFVFAMLNLGDLRASELALVSAPTIMWDLLPREESGVQVSVEIPTVLDRGVSLFPLLAQVTDGYRWLLGPGRSGGPMAARSVRRIVERVRARCGLRLTSTALRKAEAAHQLPLSRAA